MLNVGDVVVSSGVGGDGVSLLLLALVLVVLFGVVEVVVDDGVAVGGAVGGNVFRCYLAVLSFLLPI